MSDGHLDTPWEPAPTGEPERYKAQAPPSNALGRRLRVLTGVDEGLLTGVWEDRARYTGLGAIIIGTATMAMLSLLDALHQIFSVFWVLLIPVALFWGCFVCAIDRWLISSTHGVSTRRWLVFAPRMVMALLFGAIIGGPLVLTVFQSAVVQRVRDDRQAQVTTYESDQRACNPVPGAAGDPATADRVDCTGLRLAIPDPAAGAMAALPQLHLEQSQLQSTINADTARLAQLNTIARDECNGVPGTGFSGVVGAGPNCTRDRQEADRFSAQSKLPQQQTQLEAVSQQIITDNATAGSGTQQFVTALDAQIAAKVAQLRSHQQSIGLLERINALGQLASSSVAVLGALILLFVFIVTVDCLPVLSKIMSGSTAYDRLVEARLKSGERVTTARLKAAERKLTADDEVELRRIESDARARMEEIDEASRVARARRDAELDDQIALVAAQLRGEPSPAGAAGAAGTRFVDLDDMTVPNGRHPVANGSG